MTSPRPVRPMPAYTPHSERALAPEARLARFAADVAARLGPACAHLPPVAFDALVRDIATMKLRWADADADYALPPP